MIFVFLSISTYTFIDYKTKYHVKSYLLQVNSKVHQNFKLIQESKQRESYLLYKSIIDTKEIKELLLSAQNSKELSNIVRKKLQNIISTKKRLFDKSKLKLVHFHTPDNKSFFRMHKPRKYGDDLSSFRDTVVKTNKDKKFVSGYEMGKATIAYRFVYPLFYNGIYLGSVEISSVVSDMLSDFRRYLNTDISLLCKKDIVNRKVFDEIKKYYLPHVRFKDFYLDKRILSKQHIKKNMMRVVSDEFVEEALYNIKMKNINFSVYDKNTNSIKTFVATVNPVKGVIEGYWIVHSSGNILKNYYKLSLYSMLSITIIVFLILFFIYMKMERNRVLALKVDEKVDELRNKDKMLLQNSKLATMGEMISMIAHQWKQPLAGQRAILGSIKMKQRLKKLDEEFLNSSLKNVDELALYMSATIDDFADFFKPTKVKRVVKISDCINDSIKIIDGSLKNNSINIVKNIKDDISLEIYDREFRQLLINIVNNAKDALIDNKVENRTVTIDLFYENSCAVLTIADNAGGIPKDIIENIFEPYFSTKSKNGTGLGLYMSKIICEEHLGGFITVANNKSGAVFRIELPIIQKSD
jgi:signal transduction histidine kinase